jgi:hypothetical protein
VRVGAGDRPMHGSVRGRPCSARIDSLVALTWRRPLIDDVAAPGAGGMRQLARGLVCRTSLHYSTPEGVCAVGRLALAAVVSNDYCGRCLHVPVMKLNGSWNLLSSKSSLRRMSSCTLVVCNVLDVHVARVSM